VLAGLAPPDPPLADGVVTLRVPDAGRDAPTLGGERIDCVMWSLLPATCAEARPVQGGGAIARRSRAWTPRGGRRSVRRRSEMGPPSTYVLGSDDPEIARLDGQAEALRRGTAVLLGAAGIGEGMRVLELGTGVGHVAFQLAELVGPGGSVVAIDQSAPLLAVADSRRRAGGVGNVRFIEADAREFRDREPFDAVVARLLLFHLPDAGDVIRHHAGALRPGGLWVALDFDVGGARASPPVALVSTLLGWVETAFRGAGADPRIGARLAPLLRAAPLSDVMTFGIQPYLSPDTPPGAGLLADVVRALAKPMIAAGLVTEAELDIDTLERRIDGELEDAGAVLLAPTLVGAWGRGTSGAMRDGG
jgi:SAM-dependent methyltransferase